MSVDGMKLTLTMLHKQGTMLPDLFEEAVELELGLIVRRFLELHNSVLRRLELRVVRPGHGRSAVQQPN